MFLIIFFYVVTSARLVLGYSPPLLFLSNPQLIRIGYHCSLFSIFGYLWVRPCFWAQLFCYHCHQVRFLKFCFRIFTCECWAGGSLSKLYVDFKCELCCDLIDDVGYTSNQLNSSWLLKLALELACCNFLLMSSDSSFS